MYEYENNDTITRGNELPINRRTVLKTLGATGAVGSIFGVASAEDQRTEPPGSQKPFDVIELSVVEILSAIIRERTTAREITEQYLRRIEAFDEKINSILTVNPRATERAEELDEAWSNGGLVGPLHGVPVILKDNQNTEDMLTTGGAVTLADSQPSEDAFVVKRVREAGGVILAKANLHELAFGGTTVSSLGGQTRNPYALNRTPGGSSGGTGAAIAANMGAIGFGTDTVNSIVSPASACNLVGLRPTVGLVSRAGTIPFSETHDMVGPTTRSVADAAHLLDIIVGFDPADATTAEGVTHIPESYTNYLNPKGLENARIGVLRSVFGESEEVLAVTEDAINDIQALGGETVEVDADIDVDELIGSFFVGTFEFQELFNEYLDDLGPNAPVETLEEFIEANEFHPSIESLLLSAFEIESPTEEPEYFERLFRRSQFKQRLFEIMAEDDLDAFFYPHQRQLVAEISDDQLGRNGFLSSGTGFPSIAVPGGFSERNIPVGVQFLCRPFEEPKLIELAFAYEQGTGHRRPPKGFGYSGKGR